MKQFPWRQYFWVVLLLSLAIGLAVELQRVRKLSAFREQGVQAEAKARELAAKIATATDSQAQFGDPRTPPSPFDLKHYVGFDKIYFVAKDGTQRTVRSVYVPHVWRTDERDVFPTVTGMTDLDMLLVMVPGIALLVWVASYQVGKRTNWKNDALTFRRWGPFHILFAIAFSIFNYRGMSFGSEYGSAPYFGAFMTTMGAVFVVRYFYLCGLSAEEHARWLEEAHGSLFDFQKLRLWLRFQLRDIFWLMLAIGLASTIFVEHRRGRDLMPHRGMAEWWSNATEALQTEYNEINPATGKET